MLSCRRESFYVIIRDCIIRKRAFLLSSEPLTQAPRFHRRSHRDDGIMKLSITMKFKLPKEHFDERLTSIRPRRTKRADIISSSCLKLNTQ